MNKYTFSTDEIKISGTWLEEFSARLAGYSYARQSISVGIASCEKGDGASTVTLNLARYLTEHMDCNVVIIDANTVNPSIHKAYSTHLSPGLTDCDLDNTSVDQLCIQVTNNLNIIPAGSDSISLLTKLEIIKKVISQITNTDKSKVTPIILVDLPALSNNAGTSLLAKQFNGLCLVLKSEKTRWEVAERIVSNLKAAEVPIWGVILNHYRFHLPKWLYRVF